MILDGYLYSSSTFVETCRNDASIADTREQGRTMSFLERIGDLQRTDPTPLYIQLQQRIRDAIADKRLDEGMSIATERDIATEYRISRITIRKALAGLVEEGLLARHRGAGTIVTSRVEKNFAKLSSFSEDMIARGRMPGSEWIARAEGLVSPEESMALGLSPHVRVYRFHRIRTADGEPMALEFSTIAADCLKGPDAVKDSLYRALDAAGHRPVRALQRLRAVPFGAAHAKLLGVDVGSPGLLIERRAFLPDGRPAEYTQSYYRGDAYDFVSELREF